MSPSNAFPVVTALLMLCGNQPPLTPCDVGSGAIPGELLAEPPTLRCLGFRWLISGDDNGNATVTVSYRKVGEAAWHDALPMLRVHREVTDRAGKPYTAGNLFAGSILNLDPGAPYEIRFHLSDPDGGTFDRTLSARTRSEPHFSANRQIEVFPEGELRGRPGSPRLSLAEGLAKATPGDVVFLHKGEYWGPLAPPRDGIEDHPIGFAGETGAVIVGPGAGGNVVEASGRRHLWFTNLTLRGAHGGIKANGASDLVVTRCRIQDVNCGIISYTTDATGWYVADNEITGRVKNWYPRIDSSDTGINCPGTGHVVCHNLIRRFWDGISTDNIGHPKPEWANAPHPPQTAIDIYGNDISEILDDGIEADYCMHNVRVFENRVMNVHTGISAQPNLGGPLYLFRNVVYNTTNTPLKLHNDSTGVQVYHNTFVGAGMGFTSYPPAWQNSTFRNNLFLGTHGYAMETGSPDRRTTMDYDGFRRTPGNDLLVKWSGDGGKNWTRFPGLADFSKTAGFEVHGIMIDYDQLERAAPPTEGRTHPASEIDLRLRASSAAVDAGCRLSTINDAFRGRAPDLGAVELGDHPEYGPRPAQNVRP